jgi:hypothetical protein
MKFTLQRLPQDPHSTPGNLSVDGQFAAVTLELPVKDGQPGSAIPAGTYRIVIYPSPHFGRPMPLLENVPGRSGVEIHWGDFPDDTRGCLLVGCERSTDAIWHTQEKFAELFPAMQAAVEGEGCWIEVIDAPNDSETIREAAAGEN